MTDEEIVKACAEKVMGWRLACGWWFTSKACTEKSGHTIHSWNPLTDDADACAVLDKMQEDGWRWILGHHVRISFSVPPGAVAGWFCELSRVPQEPPYRDILEQRASNYDPTPAGRRRAIVLAALKAKGVEV